MEEDNVTENTIYEIQVRSRLEGFQMENKEETKYKSGILKI
jgi:hypothetical protein